MKKITKSYYLVFVLIVFMLSTIGCSEGDPKLKVSPKSLDFGTEQTQKNFTIENVGNDDGLFESGVKTLNYSIYDYKTWISKSPTSGSCSEYGSDNITVYVSRDNLSSGNYQGNVTVSSNGGTEYINIYMEVEATGTVVFDNWTDYDDIDCYINDNYQGEVDAWGTLTVLEVPAGTVKLYAECVYVYWPESYYNLEPDGTIWWELHYKKTVMKKGVPDIEEKIKHTGLKSFPEEEVLYKAE